MKPPGGNYKPNVMNVGRIPKKAPGAGAQTAGSADNAAEGAADIISAGVMARGDTAGAEGAEFAGAKGAGAAENNVSGASSQAGAYTSAKIMAAAPAELILMMFEQFLELIPDIKDSISKGSQGLMEADSERAQAIVEELINSLDFDVELSRDIGAIYVYVRNKILEANIKFDAAIWDHIESIMRPLYEAFREAAAQAGADAGLAELTAANPSIMAGLTYGQNSLKEVVVNTKGGLRA